MTWKVLLVDPPFHAFLEYDRWWYSLSGAQLAASLLEKGIEAYVYDADKYFIKDPRTKQREEMVRRQGWYMAGVQDDDHYIWHHFRKTLSEIKPDVVGVTSWTSKMPSTFKVLEICRSFDPDIKTCLGGYHASAVPDDFRHNTLVDAVFTGPAEYTLPKWILNACKAKFVTADPRSLDVRSLPSPSREALLFPEHYSATDMGALMTSRGCPYNCTFCANNLLYGLKYQMRTTEQVRQEIEHVIDRYGAKRIYVADANFLVNLRKSLEMAEVLKSFGLPWGCEGRIDAISEDLLEKLISCGCTNISFGIETETNRGMRILNKGITVEQVQRASEILHKYKIQWKCFFIIGFPHETLEDMEQTRRLALSINASYMSLNSFVPLPGTDIYNTWASTFDNIPRIYEYNQLNPKATFIKDVSPDVYREKFLSILKDFDAYNNSVKAVDEFHGEIDDPERNSHGLYNRD
jgi:radical SAM superfamily enzyme YgiQ (UPF0313 family)